MATDLYIGFKGGGKTLFAVRQILRELRLSNRQIVVNQAFGLKLERMAEYLEKNYGSDFDIAERVTILTDAQACEYWLYYGHKSRRWEVDEEFPDGHWVFEVRKIQGRREVFEEVKRKVKVKAGKREESSDVELIDRPDWTERKGFPAVLYGIDEVDSYFDSARWQRVSGDGKSYMKHERKFGDDTILIAQDPSQLAKAFRILVTQVIEFQNLGHTKVGFGMFRGPGGFVRRHFHGIPTKSDQAFETKPFQLDREGIASCYDTSAGVGLVGGDEADKEKKFQGLNVVWLPIVLVLLVLGGCQVHSWATAKVKTVGDPKRKATAGSKTTTNVVAHSEPIQNRLTLAAYKAMQTAPASTNPPATHPDRKSAADANPVHLTGFSWIPGQPGEKAILLVMLSDGRTFTSEDRSLQAVGRDYVRIDGQRYEFQARRPEH